MGIDPKRFKRDKGGVNKSAWADWLTDAKPSASAQQEIRDERVKQANVYTPRPVVQVPPPPPVAPQAPTGGVSIQINLPEFHKPQFRRSRAWVITAWTWLRPYLNRKRVVVASVIFAVIALSWVGLAITKHQVDVRTAKTAAAAAAAKHGSTGTGGTTPPTFTPAVPSSEQELSTPDGVHSRFDPNKQSYSFYDTITNKKFIVSEQKTASAAAASATATQAAKQLQATTQLKTGWGTAYISTYATNDSQRVVLAVRDLLVLIQSSYSFTNDQWTSYLNSLQ